MCWKAMGPASFCIGDSLLLFANPSSGYLYQWYRNNQSIPNAIQPFFFAKNYGSYYVSVIDTFCTDNSNIVQISTPCVILDDSAEVRLGDDSENSLFEVKPNPAHDFISIHVPYNGNSFGKFELYNTLWQPVIIEKFNLIHNIQDFSIDISTLSRGIYLAYVFINDQTYFKRKIVVH